MIIDGGMHSSLLVCFLKKLLFAMLIFSGGCSSERDTKIPVQILDQAGRLFIFTADREWESAQSLYLSVEVDGRVVVPVRAMGTALRPFSETSNVFTVQVSEDGYVIVTALSHPATVYAALDANLRELYPQLAEDLPVDRKHAHLSRLQDELRQKFSRSDLELTYFAEGPRLVTHLGGQGQPLTGCCPKGPQRVEEGRGVR